MKDQRFFLFIHSLSPNQKTILKKAWKGKRETRDQLLYHRILSEKVFDEAAAKRIRGKEFKSPNTFFTYRYKLVIRILTTLVTARKERPHTLALILEAVEMDLPELADKITAKAATSYLEKENHLALRQLLENCSRITKDYCTFFHSLKKLPSLTELNQLIENSNRWQSFIQEIRQSLKTDHAQRQFTARKLLTRIQDFHTQSKYQEYQRLKVQIGIQQLQANFYDTFLLQEELIQEYVLKNPILSGINEIKEITQAIALATIIGDENATGKLIQAFNHFLPKNPIEIRIKAQKQAAILVFSGEHFANLAMVEQGLEIIEHQVNHFNLTLLPSIKFFAALTYFYHGRYQKAFQLNQEVLQFKSDSRKAIPWEPEFLNLLIHFEKGNGDVVEALLYNTIRTAKKTGDPYPALVLSLFKKFLSLPESDYPQFIESSIHEIDKIKQLPADQRIGTFWGFSNWLTSKLNKEPQWKIISENAKKRLQKWKTQAQKA